MGGVASRDQATDTSVVHARACCDECRSILEGLLGDEQRKTGWMRAEAAGDPGPWRQQAILVRGDWDADALRDIVHDYVIEHLANDDAVLVIDAPVFSNRAKHHAEWRGNTLVRQGRSRTARSVSSLPTFRVMAMRSSIARCIFRRNGPTIQIVWKPLMCLPTSALRPNQSLRRNLAPGKSQNITTPPLIRWSIQEIRRIAIRLARKRIQPAHIIATSGNVGSGAGLSAIFGGCEPNVVDCTECTDDPIALA